MAQTCKTGGRMVVLLYNVCIYTLQLLNFDRVGFSNKLLIEHVSREGGNKEEMNRKLEGCGSHNHSDCQRPGFPR